MSDEIKTENSKTDGNYWQNLRAELIALDQEEIVAEGLKLKPSQCYRITNKSLQVMYNTNCPDTLKEKIESILEKYSQDENHPVEQDFFFP